jgi:hypothetical protein
MTWVPLKVNSDYEINNEYPYEVRKKKTGLILKNTKHETGWMIRLDKKLYQKHRIVMEQFNPSTDESKCIVDRKNGDKNDYHLDNLV